MSSTLSNGTSHFDTSRAQPHDAHANLMNKHDDVQLRFENPAAMSSENDNERRRGAAAAAAAGASYWSWGNPGSSLLDLSVSCLAPPHGAAVGSSSLPGVDGNEDDNDEERAENFTPSHNSAGHSSAQLSRRPVIIIDPQHDDLQRERDCSAASKMPRGNDKWGMAPPPPTSSGSTSRRAGVVDTGLIGSILAKSSSSCWAAGVGELGSSTLAHSSNDVTASDGGAVFGRCAFGASLSSASATTNNNISMTKFSRSHHGIDGYNSSLSTSQGVSIKSSQYSNSMSAVGSFSTHHPLIDAELLMVESTGAHMKPGDERSLLDLGDAIPARRSVPIGATTPEGSRHHHPTSPAASVSRESASTAPDVQLLEGFSPQTRSINTPAPLELPPRRTLPQDDDDEAARSMSTTFGSLENALQFSCEFPTADDAPQAPMRPPPPPPDNGQVVVAGSAIAVPAHDATVAEPHKATLMMVPANVEGGVSIIGGDDHLATTEYDPVIDTNVFVSGLTHEIGDLDLYHIFRPFGPISLAEVVRDCHSGVSRCVGFVQFVRKASAERAVAEMHQKTIHHPSSEKSSSHHSEIPVVGGGALGGTTTLTLRVRMACEERQQSNNNNNNNNNARTTSSSAAGGVGGVGVGSSSSSSSPPLETNKIFVRHVPPVATTKSLSAYFGRFGTVTSCTIHKDISRKGQLEKNGMNMGYVTFQRTSEAVRVSRLEHRNIPLFVANPPAVGGVSGAAAAAEGGAAGAQGGEDAGGVVVVFPGPLIVKLAETLARRNHRLSSHHHNHTAAPTDGGVEGHQHALAPPANPTTTTAPQHLPYVVGQVGFSNVHRVVAPPPPPPPPFVFQQQQQFSGGHMQQVYSPVPNEQPPAPRGIAVPLLNTTGYVSQPQGAPSAAVHPPVQQLQSLDPTQAHHPHPHPHHPQPSSGDNFVRLVAAPAAAAAAVVFDSRGDSHHHQQHQQQQQQQSQLRQYASPHQYPTGVVPTANCLPFRTNSPHQSQQQSPPPTQQQQQLQHHIGGPVPMPPYHNATRTTQVGFQHQPHLQQQQYASPHQNSFLVLTGGHPQHTTHHPLQSSYHPQQQQQHATTTTTTSAQQHHGGGPTMLPPQYHANNPTPNTTTATSTHIVAAPPAAFHTVATPLHHHPLQEGHHSVQLYQHHHTTTTYAASTHQQQQLHQAPTSYYVVDALPHTTASQQAPYQQQQQQQQVCYASTSPGPAYAAPLVRGPPPPSSFVQPTGVQAQAYGSLPTTHAHHQHQQQAWGSYTTFS